MATSAIAELAFYAQSQVDFVSKHFQNDSFLLTYLLFILL